MAVKSSAPVAVNPQLIHVWLREPNRRTVIILGFLVIFALGCLFRRWRRLSHIPGPLLASLTDLERARWVLTKRAHLIHQELHQKYGPVVRIGPNAVIFDDPEAITTVYPMRAGFPKSDFYAALRPYSKDSGSLQVVFNTQDEDLHKVIKTPIAPLFSVTSSLSFEPLIDGVLEVVNEKLDLQFAQTGKTIDLGDYCQFYAFDVMGMMTFSKRHGFLDHGKDINNMIGALHNFMKTVAPMTQVPTIDKILYKNRLADYIRRGPGMKLLQLAGNAIGKRKASLATGESSSSDQHGQPKDFLAHFLEAQSNNSSIPPWSSTAWTFSNIVAGSDSVGTVIRTVLYHLLVNPVTLECLIRELDKAGPTLPYPKYSEVRDLAYLEACVQEAIRMHPPFNLPLERVVPEGGVTVLGRYIPGGTKVGGSPYVVNRHKATFGDDAEVWRPERWLAKGIRDKKNLEQSMLTFGAGRRVCLGKHVGILEIKKFIPFLLLNYKVQIVDPAGFEVENIWFFRQKGLFAEIKRR